MKKVLPYSVTVFFAVLLVVLIGYLYLKTEQQSQPQDQVPPSLQITPPPYEFGDVIRKQISLDLQSVAYELEGSFPNGLERRDDGLLAGSFVIKGDSKERSIPVLAGSLAGNVFLGKYDGSFYRESSWSATPTSEAVDVLQKGEDVLLRIEIELSSQQEFEAEYNRLIDATLNGLHLEFKGQSEEGRIPDDFILIPDRIGIIR